MQTSEYGLGITKQELAAIVEFCGRQDDSWVDIHVLKSEVRIRCTDGVRVLRVDHTPADMQWLGVPEGTHVYLSPDLLRDAAKMIARADCERCFLRLPSLLKAEVPGRAHIVDVEADHETSVVSRAESVSTQHQLDFDAAERCRVVDRLLDTPASTVGLCSIDIDARYLASLSKLVGAAKMHSARFYLPDNDRAPVRIVVESACGDVWQVMIMPLRSGGEQEAEAE